MQGRRKIHIAGGLRPQALHAGPPSFINAHIEKARSVEGIGLANSENEEAEHSRHDHISHRKQKRLFPRFLIQPPDSHPFRQRQYQRHHNSIDLGSGSRPQCQAKQQVRRQADENPCEFGLLLAELRLRPGQRPDRRPNSSIGKGIGDGIHRGKVRKLDREYRKGIESRSQQAHPFAIETFAYRKD